MFSVTRFIIQVQKRPLLNIPLKTMFQRTDNYRVNCVTSSYFTRSFLVNKKYFATNVHDSFQSEAAEFDEIEYQQLVNRYLHMPDMGHQVLVVQPYVKWGPSKKKNTTPELQLSEATSLISTLSKWRVVEEVCYLQLYTLVMKRL